MSWLSRLTAAYLGAAVVGCSSRPSLTVSVENKESRCPAKGLEIVLARPPSAIERIIDPVSYSYFPWKAVASAVTDEHGRAVFREDGPKHELWIYSAGTQSLVVTVWGGQVALAPDTNYPTVTNWCYTIWREHGMLKCAAWFKRGADLTGCKPWEPEAQRRSDVSDSLASEASAQNARPATPTNRKSEP